MCRSFAILLTTLLPFYIFASQTVAQEYTALGDGWAAGVGADGNFTEVDECRQNINEKSYPHYLAKFNISLTPTHFQACSGAFANDVKECEIGNGKDPGFECRAVQPAGVGSPEFITITVGALDAGINKAILECVYETCPPEEDCAGCDTRLANVDRNIDVIADQGTIETVIQAAKKLTGAEFSNIYVTGYPSYWNVDGACPSFVVVEPSIAGDAYLSHDFRVRMNAQIASLNKAIEEQAGKAGGAKYVDVDPKFDGHRWCEATGSAESWFNGWLGFKDTLSKANREGVMTPEPFFLEGSFLPAVSGQVAIANAIKEAWGGFPDIVE